MDGAEVEDKVKCRRCGSTQIHAEKRGYTATRGLIGANEIYLTCLKCGHKFNPGPTVGEQFLSYLDEQVARHEAMNELERRAASGDPEDVDAYANAKQLETMKILAGL